MTQVLSNPQKMSPTPSALIHTETVWVSEQQFDVHFDVFMDSRLISQGLYTHTVSLVAYSRISLRCYVFAFF